MRHSIRRAAATTAAGSAAAAIVGLSIAAPAAATTVVPDGTDQLVRVELHTLEPAAPEPGDRVEISGSITNVTDDPLHNVQALLRYDGRPLTTRSDVARISTDADLHWGWRPGHIYDIVGDDLAPGESASFDLEFAVDTVCLDARPEGLPCLGLPSDGVYAIGVDGNVTTTDDVRQTGGTARTVVPWQIDDAEPIPVALLWPVVGTPDIGDGALGAPDEASGPAGTPEATPSPSDEPSADGAHDGTSDPRTPDPSNPDPNLDRLLAAPGDAPVTWAIDPETWSPTVADAIGGTGEMIVLPPSLPDAGALANVDRGLADDVATEARRLQREFTPSGTASVLARTDAAWPGAGTLSSDALGAWADGGYDTVVLPREAVSTSDPSATATLDVGGKEVSAILTDPGLGSAIEDNARPGEAPALSAALDLRQRWLAETALARDEPFRAGTAALVAAPPAGWRPDPEVMEALLDVWTGTDWITPVAMSAVSGDAPPRRADTPAAVLNPLFTGTDGLPDDYARKVRRLHEELTRYHSLVGDPDESTGPDEPGDPDDPGESSTEPPGADPTTTPDTPDNERDTTTESPGADASDAPDYDGDSTTEPPSAGATAVPREDGDADRTATPALTAARAASVVWRDDLETAESEVAALRREASDALAGVSVVVNPSNTLSGNTGVFPVNIANELAHAVTVRLEFDPANEDRLAIEPIETRVPGGQQQTVQVRAEAVANGEVPVSVQLATVEGAPLGRAQNTIVNATDYGTIGWFVVGGSALLFAGGLSWRMLRGRRRTGQ